MNAKRMKNSSILLVINLLLVLALAIYTFFYKAEKMAFVDSNVLLSQYQGMIDARADYNKLSTEWQARIDTLAVGVQNELKRHEKELSKMSKREKELSEQLLRNKQQQLVSYQRAIQDKAAEEDSKMTQGVITEVNAYLKEFGRKQSYKIIFAATNAGNILYADDAIDITEDVLEGLNRRYIGQ